MRKARVFVGCSGWNYPHWRRRFYPDGLKQSEWLEFYARHFCTVEINNTFYQLPEVATFRRWAAQVPGDFVYSVKANSFITHRKKLKEVGGSLETFIARARELGSHLGPILYQLPPRWRVNLDRLRSFLDLLPSDLIHVFEFRDQSWLESQVLDLLADRGCSFCCHDLGGLDVPRVAVGKIAYIRFHGTLPGYGGGYPESALRDWWRWMRGELDNGRDVYVYFNNDVNAHAIADALTLKRIVGVETRPDRGLAK